jgi:hypothetical protein
MQILTMREQAIQRIDGILKSNASAYEGPADLLADLIHYLGDDFESVLYTAHMYVTEEESFDTELTV